MIWKWYKKQAMQFLKIKMAAGWFGFATGFPDIPLLLP